jgi:1-aminocyclopropane-1-carboxylate deaminase/D-cysteine desulfhydrase-like pyridoxal-dependent ACC family enzyme
MIAGIDDRLALLPTPLERSPVRLPGGASLLVKRDDLTGLGLGGNKARKLDALCAEALEAGADSLVTIGGAQSNHCRMTAAAGARLGLPVHLVLGGDREPLLAGNQLLMDLFGAELRFAGTHDWGQLLSQAERLVEGLRSAGSKPALIPIGGSTPVGASAFAAAYLELVDQLEERSATVAAVVHTSSSGGTHAGLLAGQALARAQGRPAPHIVAIAVAKDLVLDVPYVTRLANDALAHLGHDLRVDDGDVDVDPSWIGPGYEVPTAEGDEAIRWAARHGGWVLDRTYTGKGFAGLLGHASAGRWDPDDTVVFWHTGGAPALFTPGGAP